jgi:heme/copper-type cytochrome/quinol oxidase subunit 2
MSSSARIGVVVATIAVLVLAFVLLSPEANDDSNTADTPTTTAPATTNSTTTTTTTTAPTGGTPAPSADHEPAPPAPTVERVRVRGGKPVGAIRKITVKKGDRARIEVTTTDTTDEIHLHGYDITRDLEPGSRARFSFEANAEGIFEIELHDSGAQIAELVVEP